MPIIRRRTLVSLCALALSLALYLSLNANATLNNSFCHFGSGAGQCDRPQSIAVDTETNRVYVADSANNRIDVFKTDGEFLFAFGWGVDTGAAKLETCTTASTCQAGIAGSGAGQFKLSALGASGVIAVDNSAGPSKHDIYVGEEANRRVQKFDPSGNFLLAFGGGVIAGGASGSGNLTSGSTTISSLKATNKEFALGQTITGAGIPAETTITAITTGASATLILSKAAEETASGVALSVAEGAGNKPINEKQTVELKGGPTGGTLTLTAPARQGFSSATTATIAFNATAATVKERLEALATIGAANVEVSGAAGGPWTVEFKGALADTNLEGMAGNASGLTPPGGKSVAITTAQDGTAAAEVCAIAANCQRGVTGSALGLFNGISGVAVTGAGTTYVVDSKLEGECGGGEEKNKERLQKFKDNGEAIEVLSLGPEAPCGPVNAIAVDSAGSFYVANGGNTRAIRKYNSSATLVNTIEPGRSTSALAVDSAGNVYAAQRESKVQTLGSYDPITRFDGVSGEPLRRFAYGEIDEAVLGLAAGNAGHIFASEGFNAPDPKVLDLTEPPGGPLVPPPSLKATTGATLATVKAEINPEGKSTEFHFQYVTQQDYEEQGNSFVGGKTQKTTLKTVSPTDFKLHKIEELLGCTNPGVEGPEGKCLTPETVYRFRILASNPDGSGNTSLEDGSFKTKAAPELLDLWASNVGPDSATLGVELNPFLIPTQGFFEYVTEAQFQASGFSEASKAPTAGGISFGEGEGAVKREVSVFPLQPGTTYHYRFHATTVLSEVIGEEATLKTFTPPQIEPCENDPFRYGLGALLPDCRAYEMVTPLDKGGADIVPGQTHLHAVNAALNVSSVSGGKLAYGTLNAFGDAEAAPYVSQYLASRDPEAGWASHALAGPRTTVILTQTSEVARDSDFKVFSPDLCEAWLLRVSEPLLDPNGVAGYPNLMRRANGCEEGGEASYEAITRGKPLDLEPEDSSLLVFEGLSDDGAAAIYDWNDNLEGVSPAPAPQPAKCVSEGILCDPRLYKQKQGGPPEFVCILPYGEPLSGPCWAGSLNGGEESRDSSVQNAISADGERVFWTAGAVLGGPLYARIGGSETVAVSKTAEEEAGSSSSKFWGADENGTKAIFTSGGRLYEFAVDTKTTTLVAKGVQGVAGVSEDAMKTYFVSTEAIAGSGENSEGDKAIAGKPNLYLRDATLGGGIGFIATVVGVDVSPPGPNNVTIVAGSPVFRANRVSSDGMHLAFMSAGSPTGYDNTDASSGEADTEVYLYEATEDELICASCNPSGGRPAGELDEYARREQWVGAKIPTWNNILYAPRVLSDDGSRLFFESPDALVARDTNGERDIYEWEAPGVGTCEEASYSYSTQNQGCLDLVSSGKGARGAEFVDASPSGEDVFFSYQQSLVGQDSDELVDIYDARVGGGFPPPPPPPLICEAEACQHPAEAPQFQTPSSEQYEGPEGEEEKPKKRKHKHKHRKHKHHKHHRRQGR